MCLRHLSGRESTPTGVGEGKCLIMQATNEWEDSKVCEWCKGFELPQLDHLAMTLREFEELLGNNFAAPEQRAFLLLLLDLTRPN